MKKFVIATVIFLLFATLVLEIGLRIVLPDFADEDEYMQIAFEKLLNTSVIFDPSGQNYSEKFGFKLSPYAEIKLKTKEYEYTAKTNSLGFRSKEIQARQNKEYRVLLIGDSFIWGTGINEAETLSTQLEHIAEQLTIPHLPLSVYNYAVIGYNTVQELLVLKTYARRVNPDHVILGFFPGNDVISNAIHYLGAQGNIASSLDMIENVKQELKRSYSFLFHSIVFRILTIGTYVPKVRYEIAAKDEIIERSYALLKAFKSETQSLGARLLVVIIQPRDSVSGGLVQAWSNSRKIGYMIRDFCRRNDIEVIDMLDFMNGPQDMKKYFYQKDGHYNKVGLFITAKTIFNECLLDVIRYRKRQSLE